MSESPCILLIDENAKERALTALVLRENIPDAEILEVGSGLDYALGLAQSELAVAISAPRSSWGEGPEILSRVQRRHPHCAAMLLAEGDVDASGLVAPGLTGIDCFRKSSSGLAELARAVRHRLGGRAGTGVATTDVSTAGQPPDPYDHLWTELEAVHTLAAPLLDDEALGPYSRQKLAGFLHATARLRDTIDYLFGERSKADAERVPVNLADVVLGVMRALQPTLHATAATVLAGRMPVLLVNRQHLTELVHHLIDNAVKFRGPHPPRITVRARKLEGRWQLSVEDNGIGVDPALGASIFDMFVRSTAATGQSGTGLGLAVCQRIVSLYDGDIRFEANRSGGTTFYASLRVAEVESEQIHRVVQCNGRPVGEIEVEAAADRNAITRAALALPELNAAIGDLTLKDVQLLENGVVNIVV